MKSITILLLVIQMAGPKKAAFAEEQNLDDRGKHVLLNICKGVPIYEDMEPEAQTNYYAKLSHDVVVNAVYRLLSDGGLSGIEDKGYNALFHLSVYAQKALPLDFILNDIMIMERREKNNAPSSALICAYVAYAVYGRESTIEFFRVRCGRGFWNEVLIKQDKERVRLTAEPQNQFFLPESTMSLADPRLGLVKGLIVSRCDGLLRMLADVAVESLRTGDVKFGSELQRELENGFSREIAFNFKIPPPTDQGLKQYLRFSDKEWAWLVSYANEFWVAPSLRDAKFQESKIHVKSSPSSLGSEAPVPDMAGGWRNSSIFILIVTCLLFVLVCLRLRQKE